MDFVYQGKCWKFGDNLAVDADLTKKEFASSRETRLEVLREFVMCGVERQSLCRWTHRQSTTSRNKREIRSREVVCRGCAKHFNPCFMNSD